jgi:Fe-S cluster assembly protein SufD
MAALARNGAALAARIEGHAVPSAGFSALPRARAMARLQAMGLPQGRDEYWRYTSPETLNAPQAGTVIAARATDAPPAFDGQNALKIVFTDGVFDADASDDLSLAGVHISRLAHSADQDAHWAADLYGALEERGQTPVARPFAALNTALARDGVLLHVTATLLRPISIIYVHNSDTSDVMLHHCIRLDAGAEATVLESGPLGARGNCVMEMDLAAGAALHHIRTQTGNDQRCAITHIFARLGDRARLKTFTLSANGALTRNEAVIELLGEAAQAHIAGAALGDGAAHHDDTVFITHQGRACESRQVFKKVLKNGAIGVFQGKILVRQSAQKTDGYQISQSLLLDGESQFLAKPELEIYADDVKCSHGSTSGAIDETALFYLQSRGVPRAQAQALLVLAFLAQAIDEIADSDIADDIRARLESLLAQSGGAAD